MITGIDHVGICSIDTDKLQEWYVNVLGFKVISVNESKTPKTYFIGDDRGSMIEIYSANEMSAVDNNKIAGIRHIALLTSDFDQDYDRIKDQVEIIGEPNQSATGNKTVFFRDPDGNILHLIYRRNTL